MIATTILRFKLFLSLLVSDVAAAGVREGWNYRRRSGHLLRTEGASSQLETRACEFSDQLARQNHTQRCLSLSHGSPGQYFGFQGKVKEFYGFREIDFVDNRLDGTPKIIALLIRGESFRGKASGRTVEEQWEGQKNASQSQVQHVIQAIKTCNYEVDVFISTYKPRLQRGNASRDLLSWYEPYVVSSKFVDWSMVRMKGWAEGHGWGPQGKMYDSGLAQVEARHREGKSYHALLVIRADMVFKQSLTRLPGVRWQAVNLAFGGILGRDADAIEWFPAAYLNCAFMLGFQGHNFMNVWSSLRSVDGAPVPYPEFMLSQKHESNTQRDQNPLFYLAGRPENPNDFTDPKLVP